MQSQTSTFPYSVPVGQPFQQMFGPCRSTQLALVAASELDSFLVGAPRGRRHIIVASWFRYIERQREREKAGEIGCASPNPRARRRSNEVA